LGEVLKNSDSIALDFSGVDFMSRSFIDELLNVIGERKAKIINLKPSLKKFLNKVKKTREAINSE